MYEVPDFLTRGEVARLIPAVKDSMLEDRATSIVLAGIMSVRSFAKALLEPLGTRVGKLAHPACYTQIVFRNLPGSIQHRPDGLIDIQSGNRHWRAIVEGKIGRSELDDAQIRDYLQIAKLNGIDAVITVSNQFAPLPTHHPVRLHGPVPKTVSLYHWSWMHIVTTAILLLQDEGFENPDQRYVLSEIVRYLQHPSSGVSGFDQMNVEWRDLVKSVQTGAPLARDSEPVLNTVAAWHQEIRDLCLIMSRALGREVRLRLTRAQRADPSVWIREDGAALSASHNLLATVEVPNAAAPIEVVADLRRRALICTMRLDAPADRKGATARTNWLLRQLREARRDDIVINAIWPGRSSNTQAGLIDLFEDPKRLEAGKDKGAPVAFEVVMVKDLAGRFSGRRTFIEDVEAIVPEFYKEVGEHLRAWVPPPPKYDAKRVEPGRPSADVDQAPARTAHSAPALPSVMLLPPPEAQGNEKGAPVPVPTLTP